MCSWTNWSRNIFYWVEPKPLSKAMQTNIMQTAGNLSRFALTWCHNCWYPRSWFLLLSSALFFRSVTRYSQTLWRGKVYKRFLRNELTLGEGKVIQSYSSYRVIFLTGPPLKISLDWPPPNFLGLAPPKFSWRWNHNSLRQTLSRFSITEGGPVWDSNVFWNQLLTGQHLANSGEAQLKKYSLYKMRYKINKPE